METITQLEGRDMPSSEELNDAYSCRNQPSLGIVFLLASSLIQGGSVLPGSLIGVKPQSAEAATLEDAAVPAKNKRAQGKAIRQANSRETSKKKVIRSEEHTCELQSQSNLVCRLLLEKKKKHFPPISRP